MFSDMSRPRNKLQNVVNSPDIKEPSSPIEMLRHQADDLHALSAPGATDRSGDHLAPSLVLLIIRTEP
jgi:hypothetical protein